MYRKDAIMRAGHPATIKKARSNRSRIQSDDVECAYSRNSGHLQYGEVHTTWATSCSAARNRRRNDCRSFAQYGSNEVPMFSANLSCVYARRFVAVVDAREERQKQNFFQKNKHILMGCMRVAGTAGRPGLHRSFARAAAEHVACFLTPDYAFVHVPLTQ